MNKILVVVSVFLVQACSSLHSPAPTHSDSWTEEHLESRRWRDADELEQDYIKLASENALPIQPANVRLIGTSTENAVNSLAAKIYLIENSEYTIDLTYYIYADDLAGNAIKGALCEAVKRGVDVRIMVDSLGSFSFNNSSLKGLMQCAEKAGYVKDRNGITTNQLARVQAVVFNALTNSDSKVNNRSHDKLLIVDGAYLVRGWVVTGGRNVSLHYYGLDKHGEYDRNAFKDIEIVVKTPVDATKETSPSQLAEYYFSVLFSKPGNKKLSTAFSYNRDMASLEAALVELKRSESFNDAYQEIGSFMSSGFSEAETKFAHELDNLNATDVVEKYSINKKENSNSISGILARLAYSDSGIKKVRIVSPYLFLQSDLFKDEGVIEKSLNVSQAWLDQDPDRSIEIITNSALTSDNFFTQAVIDMHTVPTMLMSDELKETWLDDDIDKNEMNKAFTQSKAWQDLVNHPRIHFYQLGKKDAIALGGDKHYGKLHAKFLIFDEHAFVGTTNLDFRSLLYNNEVGYFLRGETIIEELNQEFELLKSYSTRWGSEDWLEMRRLIREVGGSKGLTTGNQRELYDLLESTGLKYQF
ncbi:phospholipase D-like domain-containing protein [uncultured Vibrio sp.]|uniref:phospholipase D-like domain-containing protein n=1 Tax=uncultured Vibrio sp. TaxID=114054 RepID=UPI0025FEA97C|nr:phospholipase D-like domain-containing protein [uncultured Vibrio sp.]